jgi:hypothetical protein
MDRKQLDLRYWEEVNSELVKESNADSGDLQHVRVFRPVDTVATQVLFAADGTPLVALQLVAEPNASANASSANASANANVNNANNAIGSVMYTRTDEVAATTAAVANTQTTYRTHALVNADTVPFSFVLTNFSHEHRIYAPLFRTDANGNKTGGLVNEINVIEPWSVQVIPADYSAGNRRLILDSLKTGGPNNNGKTVKQDETDAASNKRFTEGLYFFITIQPPATGADHFAKLFPNAQWKTEVDFIVPRLLPPPPPPTPTPPPPPQLIGWSVPPNSVSRFSFGNPFLSTQVTGRFGPPGGGLPLPPPSFFSSSASSSTSFSNFGPLPPMSTAPASFIGDNFSFAVLPPTFGEPVMRSIMPQAIQDAPESELEFAASDSALAVIPASGGGMEEDEKGEVQNLIWESKASTVKHGDKVAVAAESCTVPFDPVKCSPRCVLGVSVSLGLMLAGTGPIDLERLGLHIAATCHGFLQALEVKPYVADDCVICLDSRPDTVLYPCRHQCCHYNCVKDLQKKCPICRATVRACVRPPKPIIPHPKPERRAKQTIPMSVLEQERQLWKKMFNVKTKSIGKEAAMTTAATAAAAAAVQTAAAVQELTLAKESIRVSRVSIELMKMELEKHLTMITQREQQLGELANRLQMAAARDASAGILCPKLHQMTWMNTRPTAGYDTVGFGCDVCKVAPIPYNQGFSHCDACANYDLCNKCTSTAQQLISR